MRRFFWILAFVNLGLLAYFNLGFLLPTHPEIKLTEINADKIKLLTPVEIEALPKKAALASPSANVSEQVSPGACFEWGIFSDANLTKVQTSLARLSIQAITKDEHSNQPKRYWVYKPPLKTASDAQKKASEFKALGVNDLFVVQEEKWKNAISFGIFEDEQLADKLIRELRDKGIRNIEKTIRSNDRGQYSLTFSHLPEDEVNALKRLKTDFPTAELKEVSCHALQ